MTLLGTYKLTANTQQFSEDRHMHQSLLQEGVVDAGDYKVTPGGASLQWSVAAGVAWVQGDTTARQGLYPQVNDAAVTGTVAAGNATNPRLDQVILQIADSSVTGASNTPTLSTLAGTATAGATLANRTGAAALPATALRLADILVPAAHSGVLTTGMINDRRTWARGGYKSLVLTPGDQANTAYSATTWGVVLSAASVILECSGAPLRCSFRGSGRSGTAGSHFIGIDVDGALSGTSGTTDRSKVWTTATTNIMVAVDFDFTPAAGRHTIAAIQKAVTGNHGWFASSTNGAVEFAVHELLRGNADNS